MKKKIVQIILLVFSLSSVSVMGQEVNKDYLDGQIYVKMKDNVPINFDTSSNHVDYKEVLPFLSPLAEKYQLQKVEASFYFLKSDKLRRTFRLTFNSHSKVEDFIKDLAGVKDVDYAEKVPLCKISLVPNDLSADWGCLGLQYYLHDINAPQAWDLTTGSSSVVIAIVDDAIDINHEDLSANVVSARDVSDNDNDPTPPSASFNHGTHCAGIASAKNNNGKGYASIGYSCGLMAIKVTSNSGSPANFTHGYEGITWAATHGADIISCSWGSSGYSATNQTVIDDADSLGALIVAAAGNDNTSTPHYPAAYNHVIAVASLDCNDEKSSFSNFGTWVDICTYGSDIYSTLPFNNYGKMNGTSMACPMVAGLCGLIWSRFPSYTADEVEIKLKQTAFNIYPDNPGFTNQLGAGRINASSAVQSPPCFGSVDLDLFTVIPFPPYYYLLHTESSGSLELGSPVSGIVKLDATTSVTLTPGFHAAQGNTFNAYIDGCGGAR